MFSEMGVKEAKDKGHWNSQPLHPSITNGPSPGFFARTLRNEIKENHTDHLLSATFFQFFILDELDNEGQYLRVIAEISEILQR